MKKAVGVSVTRDNSEEVERAGVNFIREQHTTILRILEGLVSWDVQSIQKLLLSIPGGEKKSGK
jgi:hypothetical protein